VLFTSITESGRLFHILITLLEKNIYEDYTEHAMSGNIFNLTSPSTTVRLTLRLTNLSLIDRCNVINLRAAE